MLCSRPACHPTRHPPPREKVKKSQKKSKKCFTRSSICETLYLSRGTGPLDKVGIPPARPLKGRWKKIKKAVDSITPIRLWCQ